MNKTNGLSDKNVRIFMLLIAIAVTIGLIVSHINTFANVLLVILGFGAVVLVHEFGHFLFAKLAGIKVEAFSIGFSPVLFGILKTEEGFRIRVLPGFFPTANKNNSDDCLKTFTIKKMGKAGETEYRIGMIPFGGFVKMLGQEDTKVSQQTNDPRSYANKPIGARMAVIAAGVTFNVISALIIFMTVFSIGIKKVPPVIGAVEPNSPAAKAGLKAGDEIIKIADNGSWLEFSDISMAAALSARNEKIQLKVKHENGQIEDYEITAESMETPTGKLRLFGIAPAQSLRIAKVDETEKLFERTGLKTGDVIKSVTLPGQKNIDVKTYWQFEKIIENAVVPQITMLAERQINGKKELVESTLPLILSHAEPALQGEKIKLTHICSMVPRIKITFTSKNISLKAGDIIVSAADVDNPTYTELRQITEDYEDKVLKLTVLRKEGEGNEILTETAVVPKRSSADEVMIGIGVALDADHTVVARTIGDNKLEIPSGASITAVDGVEVSDFYDVIKQIQTSPNKQITINYRLDEKTAGSLALDIDGATNNITVKSGLDEFVPFEYIERLYKATNPVEAVVMGYKKTAAFVAQAYVTLQRFAGGTISPKNFVGPVGIVSVSYQIVTKKPFIHYIYFIGLINAFIAVFNALPLLPFDGGHIVFLLAEKIKGSPVNEKIQSIAVYAGIAVVGTFFFYVTFNDIVRSFFS